MRLLLTMITLVLGMTFITSCEKDDPEPNVTSYYQQPVLGVAYLRVLNYATPSEPHMRHVVSDAELITTPNYGYFDPATDTRGTFDVEVNIRNVYETLYVYTLNMQGDTLHTLTRSVDLRVGESYQL